MPTVKSSDIAATLSHVMSVREVRRKIRSKICAPRRGVNANEDEFILNPSYRFEHEKEVQRMATPEEVCAARVLPSLGCVLVQRSRSRRTRAHFASLISHASTVEERRHHSRTSQRRQAQTPVGKLGVVVTNSAVKQTHEFLQAAQGNKGILHLETSRRIQRLTGKFFNYIRRMTVPDPPEDRRPRREPNAGRVRMPIFVS